MHAVMHHAHAIIAMLHYDADFSKFSILSLLSAAVGFVRGQEERRGDGGPHETDRCARPNYSR